MAVAEAVGVAVSIGRNVGDDVAVEEGLAVGVAVCVGVDVTVLAGVIVGVAVGKKVIVAVMVGNAVGVAIAIAVGNGVIVAAVAQPLIANTNAPKLIIVAKCTNAFTILYGRGWLENVDGGHVYLVE